MSRFGVIELSYARSAGTGDQLVPGTVTSRRDRGKAQRQKQLRLQQEEEKKVIKERQKAAAKILKRRWAEEDRQEKMRRTRLADDEASDELHHEEDAEETHRLDEQSLIEQHGAANQHELEIHGEEDDHQDRRSSPDHEHVDIPKDRGDSRWSQVDRSHDKLSYYESRDAEQGNAPSDHMGGLATSSSSTRERRGPRLASKVAGAFGIEDDEAEARRELELAAQSKRVQAQRRSAEVLALADVRHTAHSSSTAAKPSVSMNAFEQLRKLAEWKRSCKGARRPMPEDMKDELAAVAECQGTSLSVGAYKGGRD